MNIRTSIIIQFSTWTPLQFGYWKVRNQSSIRDRTVNGSKH
uniref:Uncharacterized protein n=1 Tax=Setaria italica TaxID=4555 RepID=K3ZGH5_SETIT